MEDSKTADNIKPSPAWTSLLKSISVAQHSALNLLSYPASVYHTGNHTVPSPISKTRLPLHHQPNKPHIAHNGNLYAPTRGPYFGLQHRRRNTSSKSPYRHHRYPFPQTTTQKAQLSIVAPSDACGSARAIRHLVTFGARCHARLRRPGQHRDHRSGFRCRRRGSGLDPEGGGSRHEADRWSSWWKFDLHCGSLRL